MRDRPITYKDAIRLLPSDDGKIAAAIDKILGGIVLAAGVVAGPKAFALLGAKNELVKLGHQAEKRLLEKRRASVGIERSELTLAAHSIIVVTAFFEALEDGLGEIFNRLHFTQHEQLWLMKAAPDDSDVSSALVKRLALARIPTPGPHSSFAQTLESLKEYYSAVTADLLAFLVGLREWETVDEDKRAALTDSLRIHLPRQALDLYQSAFVKLAAEAKEFLVWAILQDNLGTRSDILSTIQETSRGVFNETVAVRNGLVDLHRMMDLALQGTTARALEWHANLTTFYLNGLDDPIIDSEHLTIPGVVVPALGDGYVNPRFKVRTVEDQIAAPSQESWWKQVPVRSDISELLATELLFGECVSSPLIVLGQPGSGKSLLTKILAGRLPRDAYAPIRVKLRDVAADASILDQVERALRTTLNRNITWEDFLGSSKSALPVLLFDGFDELLQATGAAQSDYLERVREFQRNELRQGRPVAAIVTSRTVVADRARIPFGSIVIKLESFDDDQISQWLAIWNGVNADFFRESGLNPLAADVVMGQSAIAREPLLLLMLAIYDADGNALSELPPSTQSVAIYESLLVQFVTREVLKHQPGLLSEQLDAGTEEELQRLSIVAFAMFNRGRPTSTEAEVARDFEALHLDSSRNALDRSNFYVPLSVSEQLLGRFFFIHESFATVSGTQDFKTYEFLHATFEEYLVSRLILAALNDIDRQAALATKTTFASRLGPLEDDFLFALISFKPLSSHAQVLEYLVQAANSISAERREQLLRTVGQLVKDCLVRLPRQRFDRYEPIALDPPTRTGVYLANLVVLAVTIAGRPIRLRDWLELSNEVSWWRHASNLVRFALGEAWADMVAVIRVTTNVALLKRIHLEQEDEEEQILLHLDTTEAPNEIGLELESARFRVDHDLLLILDVPRMLEQLVPASYRAYYTQAPLDSLVPRTQLAASGVFQLLLIAAGVDIEDMESPKLWMNELSYGLSGLPGSTIATALDGCRPHVSKDQFDEIVRLLIRAGPATADVSYYLPLLRVVLSQVAEERSSEAMALARDITARFDLPHLLNIAPLDCLEIFRMAESAGVEVDNIAPELSSVDLIVERIDLAELEGTNSLKRAIEVAREYRMDGWAIDRAVPWLLTASERMLAILSTRDIAFLCASLLGESSRFTGRVWPDEARELFRQWWHSSTEERVWPDEARELFRQWWHSSTEEYDFPDWDLRYILAYLAEQVGVIRAFQQDARYPQLVEGLTWAHLRSYFGLW